MQLSIHDAHMNRIGVINNAMPRALHYSNDVWHEYLAEASSTYEFKVDKTNPAYAMITSNNYISFTTNDNDYVFRILKRKETDTDVTFTCGFMNLELTETVNVFNNTTSHSLLWYLIDPSGPLRLGNNAIEIGSNPFADSNNTKYNKVITFTEKQTKLARILYIMEQWGAEVEFITDMYNDGSFHSLILNIYNPSTDAGKLGTIRNDIILRYGTNINGVTREENGETIINAIGMTDENGKYNWNSIELKDYNDQGQLEFYKNSGTGNLMYAPISVALFPSTVANSNLEQWNRHDFSIKAKSSQDMVDYALKMFKLYAYPQVTYTVDSGAIYEMSQSGNNMSRLFHSKSHMSATDGSNYKTLVQPLKIGDIVMIQDMSFDPANNGLYLQARVTERITSWTDPSQNKYVFSNFKLMKSKIQDGLLGKMQDLINQTAPYTLEIATTDSLIFKKANDSATLTANLKKQGGLATADSYVWYQDMTDMSVPISTTQTLTVSIDSLPNTDTSVFTVQAIVDDTIVDTSQVTISKVYDGVSPINLVIESSNGYQFKNNVINTTFTAILYQNNKEIDSDSTKFSYVWSKTNSDGTADTAWNLAHKSSQKSITISNSDVFQRATFNCTAELRN